MTLKTWVFWGFKGFLPVRPRFISFFFDTILRAKQPANTMPPPPSDLLSMTAFARSMNCALETVRRYVESGDLHPPAVEYKPDGVKVKGIFLELGRKQFAAARARIDDRFALGGSTPLGPRDPDLAAALERRRAEVTDSLRLPDEDTYDHPPLRAQPHGGHLKSGDGDADADTENLQLDSEGLRKGTPAQLRKFELQLKVKKAEIELSEKEGGLLPVESVYAALFAAGQQIRAALQMIPDRVTDNILAASDRAEVHSILTEEIDEVLLQISKLGDIELDADRDAKTKPKGGTR